MNEKNKRNDTPYGLSIVLVSGHKPPTLWFGTTRQRDTALKEYKENKTIKAFKYVKP